MNDIEVKAKKIIYNIAWAVEAWRERHGGRDPVISEFAERPNWPEANSRGSRLCRVRTPRELAKANSVMPGEMLAVIKLGAPCLLNEASGWGTFLGCRMDVAAYDRVYLGEEVAV